MECAELLLVEYSETAELKKLRPRPTPRHFSQDQDIRVQDQETENAPQNHLENKKCLETSRPTGMDINLPPTFNFRALYF